MLDIIRFFIWWFLLNGIVSLYVDGPTPFYWVILIITGVIAFIMIYQKKQLTIIKRYAIIIISNEREESDYGIYL